MAVEISRGKNTWLSSTRMNLTADLAVDDDVIDGNVTLQYSEDTCSQTLVYVNQDSEDGLLIIDLNAVYNISDVRIIYRETCSGKYTNNTAIVSIHV